MRQFFRFPHGECFLDNWKAQISELQNMDYTIRIDGENIRLIYHGKDEPSAARVASLIESLKFHKKEVLKDTHFLISETLERINEVWEPSTLSWMKQSTPEEWERMLTLERKIDQYALQADTSHLRKTLGEYLTLMITVAKDFQSLRKGR